MYYVNTVTGSISVTKTDVLLDIISEGGSGYNFFRRVIYIKKVIVLDL